jgi:two-component system NtrC family sensor kinase
MKQLKKLKPAFWEHTDSTDSNSHSAFNFPRKWKLIVIVTSFMALLPLVVMTIVDFNLTRKTIDDEIKSSMLKILSAAVTIIDFSEEPENSAINFIDHYTENLNMEKGDEVFIVNDGGELLTASIYYKNEGSKNAFDTTIFKEKTGVMDVVAPNGNDIIAGYAKISSTPLTFVMIKNKDNITKLWQKPRFKLMGYLIVSVIVIILSIMGMATWLVSRIHSADKKRIEALHQVEYANKLASIARLSSGVAHEINNPLAIINQKTGLMMDLFEIREDLSSDERLITLSKDILGAVARCGTITQRLLNFARDMDASIKPVDLRDILDQTLSFLEQEAISRNITIIFDYKTELVGFESDKSCLQQIFLNLFENAFAAMDDGGKLGIEVTFNKDKKVMIAVSDNGCGIPPDDINKIFEPFYSSKDDHWGKGHGLSITYGLVKDIGGDIMVKSTVGKGARFTLKLPLKPGVKAKAMDAEPAEEKIAEAKPDEA